MEAFVWSQKYVTGVEPVDGQHQRLVNLINTFGELAAQGPIGRPEVEAALEELSAYARTHFVEEEAVMLGNGLDGRFVAQHRAQHEHFIGQVGKLRVSGAKDGGKDDSKALFRFLVGWLAFHILGWDMQMARQLKQLKDGRSPSDAYLLEFRRTDPSSGVLLDAVDDLMAVVAERNRELVAINQGLEARVAQRTAELSTANAGLVAALENLRLTQEQLLQSEKMAAMGTLSAGVAHEINNPIGFVRANVATMQEGVASLLALLKVYAAAEDQLNAATRESITRAKKAADLDFLVDDLPALLAQSTEGLERVGEIVKNLGEFSKAQAQAWQEVDLRRSLDTALNLLRTLPDHDLTFVKEYGPVPMVRCLGEQVSQALLGMLMNAAQAVSERKGGPGRITLRTGVEGELAWVEIADTGVGMSEETRAHAFEPFFTTRPVGKGIGLGLSVVWAIAQRHGGKIDVASTPGEGSTFRLWLPVKGPPSPSTEPAPTAGRYGAG